MTPEEARAKVREVYPLLAKNASVEEREYTILEQKVKFYLVKQIRSDKAWFVRQDDGTVRTAQRFHQMMDTFRRHA